MEPCRKVTDSNKRYEHWSRGPNFGLPLNSFGDEPTGTLLTGYPKFCWQHSGARSYHSHFETAPHIEARESYRRSILDEAV